MSALHMIRDGAITAAELFALLFIAPIGAAVAATPEARPVAVPTASGQPGTAAATMDARRLHLVDAALEMRFLGLLADIRVVQTVRNDTTEAVDLGMHLPAVDDNVDSFSVFRDGHSVELLEVADCGDSNDPDAGHVRASADEAIAELMQLPPGRQATVELLATETLLPSGLAWRVALPATIAPFGAQALLVTQAARGHVVVIPPIDAAGVATVILRPTAGPPRSIELGRTQAGFAYIVPVTDAATLAQLAHGAIELEVVTDRDVRWMTLAVSGPQAGAAAIARAAD